MENYKIIIYGLSAMIMKQCNLKNINDLKTKIKETNTRNVFTSDLTVLNEIVNNDAYKKSIVRDFSILSVGNQSELFINFMKSIINIMSEPVTSFFKLQFDYELLCAFLVKNMNIFKELNTIRSGFSPEELVILELSKTIATYYKNYLNEYCSSDCQENTIDRPEFNKKVTLKLETFENYDKNLANELNNVKFTEGDFPVTEELQKNGEEQKPVKYDYVNLDLSEYVSLLDDTYENVKYNSDSTLVGGGMKNMYEKDRMKEILYHNMKNGSSIPNIPLNIQKNIPQNSLNYVNNSIKNFNDIQKLARQSSSPQQFVGNFSNFQPNYQQNQQLYFNNLNQRMVNGMNANNVAQNFPQLHGNVLNHGISMQHNMQNTHVKGDKNSGIYMAPGSQIPASSRFERMLKSVSKVNNEIMKYF